MDPFKPGEFVELLHTREMRERRTAAEDAERLGSAAPTLNMETLRKRLAEFEAQALVEPLRSYAHFGVGFGFTPPPPPREQPLPELQRAAVAVAERPPAEYRELAKSVGFRPAALRIAEFEEFLEREFIEVYPLESVTRYMDTLMHNLVLQTGRNFHWQWYPLRDVDVKNSANEWAMPYRHYVPMPVLETALRIAEAFPDVSFFVTDYSEKKPDPFLAASPDGGVTLYVVERWDEPGFRS